MAGRSCDYNLLEVASVSEGLELCQTRAIDAILLDYLLPDGNGLKFLETLAERDNGSHPPVVMMTGYGDESIAVQAMKLGAHDYLSKHKFSPELLVETIRGAIEIAPMPIVTANCLQLFQVFANLMVRVGGW